MPTLLAQANNKAGLNIRDIPKRQIPGITSRAWSEAELQLPADCTRPSYARIATAAMAVPLSTRTKENEIEVSALQSFATRCRPRGSACPPARLSARRPQARICLVTAWCSIANKIAGKRKTRSAIANFAARHAFRPSKAARGVHNGACVFAGEYCGLQQKIAIAQKIF